MENPNMDPRIGMLLDGRYEPLEIIGKGGMATVYKGFDHLLNRNVAIKFLREDLAADSEFRIQFKKEGQAVAKLSHANIVSVYDVSRSPEQDYIVMELIEGVTLKRYMKEKGRLNLRECAVFGSQIAKALAHAHSKGIIHRDIKPQNIMITSEGEVKVADFGIAYLESALGGSLEKETAVGSVNYLSPEQARGQAPDARSDIYSLGVVLYEMMSGVLPYVGETAEAVTLQHARSTPPPLVSVCPDVPPELEAIVHRALEPDITKRYQNASDMARDLDAWLSVAETSDSEAELPVRVKNVEPLSRSGELAKENYLRRHRRSVKVSLLVGVLLAMAFAGTVGYFLWNYWLRDIFSDPVKISIPNFVGSDYEELMNNRELQKIYNFNEVEFVVSADVEAGRVISQDPASGKSRTRDSKGIDVALTVSAGAQMIQVPDVLNIRYTDAVSTIQKSGFYTELRYEISDTVTVDYVIATSPEPGDKIPAGATVYVTVSSGPNVVSVPMPNLMGLTREQALSRIEAANLSWGNVTYVESEKPAGYVIWQSVPAYTTVEEHTKIYIQISLGPKTTPTPAPTATPEPTAAPTEAPSSGELNPVAPSVNDTGIGG